MILKTHKWAAAAKLAALFLSIGVSSFAQDYVDFPQCKEVLSFENGVENVSAGHGSAICTSDLHSKLGSQSLCWEWKKKNASIEINGPIPYLAKNPNPKETSVSTFVFDVYSEAPMDGHLTVTFYKGSVECCHFEYGLNFSGWRGCWVAFDRDMTGTPVEGMDKVVISAPAGVKKGRLFLDNVITSSFQDVRYHTADFQVPFVNAETTVHWLVLLNSWNLKLDIPAVKLVTEKEIGDMALLRERFIELTTDGRTYSSPEEIRQTYSTYNISINPDGTLRGKPIFFNRYGETYINLGITNADPLWRANGQLLRPTNAFMMNIAMAWLAAEDEAWKAELEEMYVMMTRLLLDQGWAAGSANGTLHHLGFSMKDYYISPVIMKDVLEKAGLADEVQQAMEWFSGVGEVKNAPVEDGVDIDAFNTAMMGRVASLIMLEDSPYKVAYLKAFSRWVDNGFKYTDGFSPAFKEDGTVQHHRKAYPAYARDGFEGAIKALYMLRQTDFAVSERGHSVMKRALLEMRFYCNVKSFPIGMSGRHPDGIGALNPKHFALLALAGTPDGKEDVDRELAGAYLRLNNNTDRYVDLFTAAGITAEAAPRGTHVYPFACTMSHRDADWLVTFTGHSRYLWATETYQGCNHYGRYIAHGAMEIFANGEIGAYGDEKPISACGSGFRQIGWDWTHIPGTTAAFRPMNEMRANILNVDEYSGYEEMLLSDEWFAGGVSFSGNEVTQGLGVEPAGAYAMILHEHDKYNGSLRAHKSYFAFGNRIVALGSGLQNALEGSELHTTLFQNHMPEYEGAPFTGIGPSALISESRETLGDVTLRDRFGNAFIVKDARVSYVRGLQHSFHEETDAHTEGIFEKAYIYHGTMVGAAAASAASTSGSTAAYYKDSTDNDRTYNGATSYSKDSYEYLVLIHPSDEEVSAASAGAAYAVLRCDNNAHIVQDSATGLIGAAIFENYSRGASRVLVRDLSASELLVSASPCMLMYGVDGSTISLAVANPDLSLYQGESDEWFDEAGKRIERSVYSRTWLDNPCAETSVQLSFAGMWSLAEPLENVVLTQAGGLTTLTISTKAGRSEKIQLVR